MRKYGMPYMGSKSKYAEKILDVLPKGKRFCDLFGGGGAMTHCALITGRFDEALYNEIEPVVCDMFQKAISGYYAEERFHPWFVSREDFHKMKENDGYVRLLWSFGNDCRTYLWGDDNVPWKHALFDLIVDGKESELLNSYLSREDISYILSFGTIKQRRFATDCALRKNFCGKDMGVNPLRGVESLERLQITCGCYEQYEYRNGDVVYCDIPYANTPGERYNKTFEFDRTRFLDWAASREYPVFVSEYNIEDQRFNIVCEFERTVSFCKDNNSKKRVERIYCTKQGGDVRTWK